VSREHRGALPTAPGHFSGRSGLSRGDEFMDFRLTYEGPLYGSGNKRNRPDHKHELRRVFHRQLLRLWKNHPHLKKALVHHRQDGRVFPEKLLFTHLSEQWQRLGYSFVPLVTPEIRLICAIEILFLRPSMPGDVMQAGDLDNRLKTIFDALRLPDNKAELGGNDIIPGPDENPFCCLLTDDKLISRVSIETDMLLQPTGPDAGDNDARLVVRVELKPFDQGWDNINFG
jgi:hypothetical protein